MDMYFIAILAPREINEKVTQWKKWMKEHFGCEAALRSPAHVTLIPPFWMEPSFEEPLITALNQFALNCRPFELEINDFSSFRPRVIFLEVIRSEELLSIKEALVRNLEESRSFPFPLEERPFHPHITIATRDLHKKVFQDAWEYFQNKKYQAAWTVNDISLLRHNKKNWDVLHTSQFKNI